MFRLAPLVITSVFASTLACGDSTAGAEGSATTGGTSTGDASTGVTSTGDASTGVTSTGVTSTGSTSTGAEPTTGGTSTSGTTTTGTTEGTSAGSSSTGEGTTEGVDASSSTSAAESTTTGEDTSTGTSEAGTTEGDTTTGGETPVVAASCPGQSTSFVAPMSVDHELHIVGVYQPTGGAITVTITRTDVPITLVLSSYEPVAYTLELAPGVQLEEVVLNGYNDHTVAGQGAAVVTDHCGLGGFLEACAYFWPEKNDGCDTPGLVAAAEALTGLTLSAFVGCYEGASFTID